MSEARLAALETEVAQLRAQLERLLPKPTELELLFPGAWQKRWSGKGEGWDAEGTELFEVAGNSIKILRTTGGARTRWSVEVTQHGKVTRLRQSHRDEEDHEGFAPIEVEITGDAETGYTGTECVGDHVVSVTYSPFIGPAQGPMRAKRTRSPEDWQALAAKRKAAKRQRIRGAA